MENTSGFREHMHTSQAAVRLAMYLHSVYHQYTCFYAFLQATQYYCYIYRCLAPCNAAQVYRYSPLLPVRPVAMGRVMILRQAFSPRQKHGI